MAKITAVEFGVCSQNNNGEKSFGLIPIDNDVQKAIKKMLFATTDIIKSNKSEKFEPAQKYGEKETLYMPLADENLVEIRQLYEYENFDYRPSLLADFRNLFFYFAIFHLDNDKKTIGVRRTAQFKGVITAKNRLIQIVDDSLTLVTDDIFKLDNDFDFIIRKNNVYILRPSSLSIIANLNKYIMKSAAGALRSISGKMTAVSFDNMINYAKTHIRCAKLVASIRKRDDLNLISIDNLKADCQKNGITFETDSNGVISPAKGNELGFLQLLDRRRYTSELIEGVLEKYEAPNRRGVK